MTPLSLIRPVVSLSAALALLGALTVTACGGSTSSGGATEGVVPGDACGVDGATASAKDGCNTCTCSAGVWACTEKACVTGDAGVPPSGPCTPGQTRAAGDGCNTCQCGADGTWACTLTDCAPPPTCVDGATRSPDSCNTCTCSAGQWVCTHQACPAPVCTDGETKYDGCNTCSCMGGMWGCTARYCPPPPPADAAPPPVYDAGPALDAGPGVGCGGWLGNTCTANQYCAYEPGQMCGAADASSVCKARPQACDLIYDPVCGCDGKDYSNACVAASAGTGVASKGTCSAASF